MKHSPYLKSFILYRASTFKFTRTFLWHYLERATIIKAKSIDVSRNVRMYVHSFTNRELQDTG